MTDGPPHETRPSAGREPILVIEANADFGRALVEQLAADGHPAELARTAGHSEIAAGVRPPQLVVLGELDTPRGTLNLLETIRGHHSQTSQPQTPSPWPASLPVIVLSSRTAEPDMLRAFEAGADDFLGRPARYLELRGVNFNSRGSPDFNSWSGIWGLRLPANLGSRPVARPRKSQQRRANESRIRRIIPLGSRAPILHFPCARDQRSLITRRLSVIAALRPGRVVRRPSAAAWSSASCA